MMALRILGPMLLAKFMRRKKKKRPAPAPQRETVEAQAENRIERWLIDPSWVKTP